MIYLPILGAFGLAAGTVLERVVLKKRKVNIKLYQAASFFALLSVMLPFVFFFWKIDPLAFQLKNIFILSLIILFSVIANLLVFYSLKWEKVNNLEPARLLEPLFTILIAIIFSFFALELYERNLNVIVPAIIAGLALIFSHIKKHHLEFNKYFIAAILGSFFFALELVTSRLILNFYTPMSFYFLRSLGIFLFSFIIFRPKFNKLSGKVRLEIFLTAIFWVIYRVSVYYGYLSLGIFFTTLMLMLAPIFIYAFAKIILKEKLQKRNIVAAVVILACILYAISV